MSDHEGEGLNLDRWEEASLPGDSVFSYARSDVFNQGIVTGNSNFYPPTGPGRRFDPRRGPLSRPVNGIRPVDVRAPQQTALFSQPRRDVIPPRQIPRVIVPAKSPAQIQCDEGQPPNGEYEFASNWRHFRAMALRIDRAAQPHPLQVLREIMVKKGSYVRKPEDEDVKLFIWGDRHQVADTKVALAQWERDVQESLSQPKSAAWAKYKALDGRAEHRADRQSREKAFEQALRNAQIDYPVEAALLWPKDLDIEEFETANSEALDQIGGSFRCRITFLASNTQHVLIGAQSEKDALSVMSRLSNLIKETISRRDQLLAVNLVHLPADETFGDQVGLLNKDPQSGTFLPTLHGKPVADREQWDQERRQVHISNRKKIKKAIDSSIKGLRISQHHVRMRVVFGELGFMLFQRPAEGAETYTFGDFYNMVTKGRTTLALNGLAIRKGDVTDLPDVLNSMGVFSECTEYYGAFFDFPGTSQNNILRLETVFYPSGENDTESREKRWIEVGDKVSRLQVSLLNFERPDYQVTLDAFPLHADKATKVHMSAFQANITMERPPNGIKTLPRRRVKYPRGQRGLQRVAELITLSWRFKNTDGVFELRRKDTYDELPGRESPAPAEIKWHALYYYPHWDSLMGEYASVKPGEDIHWVKSVTTFIPEGGEQYGPALPKGFKNFISEVEEIQDILAEAIRRVVKGKGKATEVDG